MTDAVAFRVDASPAIGIGHVMRCLTLADALAARGARVRFVSRHLPAHLREIVAAHGHETVLLPGAAGPLDELAHAGWLGTSQESDAAGTLHALSDRRWNLVVVDHYALDARWETAIRAAASRVLVIDDLADRQHDCELLVDQNLYADAASRYTGRVPAGCRLMLGPRHALLREQFVESRARVTRRTGPVSRLMIGFGGVDADNHTMKAVEAVDAMGSRLSVDVVIGADHSHRRAIEEACAARGFVCHVQSARMAELMASADLAIGAGGSTTWERCCVGLPSIVVAMAANQQKLVRDSASAGVIYAPDVPAGGLSSGFIARHLQALMENASLREAISCEAMAAVDGQGTRRILQRLGAGTIAVRPATLDDSQRLFAWRNADAVRAVSRNQAPIPFAAHEQWFRSALADADRMILIGMDAGQPMGVVRFDIAGGEGEVSIYLSPGGHPPGSGSALLEAAEQWLARARPDLQRWRATVLADNVPSHRLFTGAGYAVESTSYVKRCARYD